MKIFDVDDGRVYVDECIMLSSNDMQRWGMTDRGFKGTVRWRCAMTGDHYEMIVQNHSTPKQFSVSLACTWLGAKAIPDRSIGIQVISMVSVDGGAVKGGKWKWICNQCGMTCSHLLTTRPGQNFRCRKCLGATYRKKRGEGDVISRWAGRLISGGADYKAIIVGQAPSRSSDPDRPLDGTSGRRLANLLGLTVDEMMQRFKCINLIDFYPGRSPEGKGDNFPRDEARVAAQKLSITLSGHRVICLGREVARAFGLHNSPWMKWRRVQGPVAEMWAAAFPHPSGVNKWWRDEDNEKRAGEWLRDVLMRPWIE